MSNENDSRYLILRKMFFLTFLAMKELFLKDIGGNWLCALNRANVWAFSKEVMDIYNQTRKERFEYPTNDGHFLD